MMMINKKNFNYSPAEYNILVRSKMILNFIPFYRATTAAFIVMFAQ
jgi:hypothetical protein